MMENGIYSGQEMNVVAQSGSERTNDVSEANDGQNKTRIKFLVGAIVIIVIIVVIAVIIVNIINNSREKMPAWLVNEEDESIEVAPEMSAEEIAQADNYDWGEDGEVVAVSLYCESESATYELFLDNSYDKVVAGRVVERGKYVVSGGKTEIEMTVGDTKMKYMNGELSADGVVYRCDMGTNENDD